MAKRATSKKVTRRSSKVTKARRVLAVDDQSAVCKEIAAICSEHSFDVLSVHNPKAALEALASKGPFDLLILDYNLGPRKMNGLELLEKLRETHSQLPVVFLSGEGTFELAVKAGKLGVDDWIEKDRDDPDYDFGEQLEIVLDRVGRKLELVEENRRLRAERDLYKSEFYKKYQIVGVSEAMRQVCQLVEQVAPIPRPVFVFGERGTGKELVARAIHRASPRRGAPFVTVNCAAFAEGLLECELFGQEENAFNNAPFRRGRFELADGGTLFMDEVANMSLDFQQKVLRILEYQSFERVGGGKTIQVDVRVVAATNADMRLEREKGRFRKDLYDRLAFEIVHLPPLRERPEDIGPLARHFLGLITLEVPEIRAQAITAEAISLLESYAWPGNVRELKHFVERAAYRAGTEEIGPEQLPPLEQRD